MIESIWANGRGDRVGWVFEMVKHADGWSALHWCIIDDRRRVRGLVLLANRAKRVGHIVGVVASGSRCRWCWKIARILRMISVEMHLLR